MPIAIKLTRREVEAVFETIEPYVVEMAAHRKAYLAKQLTVFDLGINAFECSAYRGCDHASRCNLTPSQRRKSVDAQLEKKMGLLEDMKKRKALQEGGEDAQAKSDADAIVKEIVESVPSGTQQVQGVTVTGTTPGTNTESNLVNNTNVTPINPPEQPTQAQAESATAPVEPARGTGKAATPKKPTVKLAETDRLVFKDIYVAAISSKNIEDGDLAWKKYQAAFMSS
jgi:hypothetical protein